MVDSQCSRLCAYYYYTPQRKNAEEVSDTLTTLILCAWNYSAHNSQFHHSKHPFADNFELINQWLLAPKRTDLEVFKK